MLIKIENYNFIIKYSDYALETRINREGYDSYFVTYEIDDGKLDVALTHDLYAIIELRNYLYLYRAALAKYKRRIVFA